MKNPKSATPSEEPKAQAKEADQQPVHIVLATETMAGDLRDLVLDALRNEHNPLPWHMRKQDEQKATIDRVTKATEYAARRAVEMIASEGKRTLTGTLMKIVSKGGALQTQIDFLRTDPLRHELFDSQGTTVMVAIADPERFLGARADVSINYDQGAIFKDDPKGEALDKRKPKEPPPADEGSGDEPEDPDGNDD